MKKNLTKKLVLSTSLLLMGAAATQLSDDAINFSSEAKAYSIGQDVTDINELTKYYTQEVQVFSNKWLHQKEDGPDKGNIYVDFKYGWTGNIKVWGPESWGNINNLRNQYVDVFGLQDRPTHQFLWSYEDYFTGGITPAATAANKHYTLSLKLNKNGQTIGVYQFYSGNKPVLTLKELDFRVRETLIKNKQLYTDGINAGEIKVKHAGRTDTVDLSKRLHSDRANHYVQSPQSATVEVNLK
ncbi:exotoxin beta-grasp domain-containing protein [Staphylococcus lutrae]|uniref:Staphylococcal/Streptococcal toxin beta-grasp domain-containing protein n=1 Tax=Staphylococcus lutrae TaxID=155085 RepID=A0AAC9WK74_9STAP|nr:hypothetical protein [Staphylococcus lutrae]ARJ51586.1 hypothetical protein B5P37_09810 [Staphylococcus lutrae]PNZ34620.1 superantigen-like protein [Staphylococcus lutrae]